MRRSKAPRLTDGAGRATIAVTMQVKLNGENREIPDGVTVADLLASLGVKPQRVAVEINETVITKDRYQAQRIGPGDSVEIVAFMGG
jgi:sulfur carrier protein